MSDVQAQLDERAAQLAALAEGLSAAQATIDQNLTAIQEAVAELKAAVGGGTPPDFAKLDAALASAQAALASIQTEAATSASDAAADAPPPPAPVQAFDPASNLPLYVHLTGSDTTSWTQVADVTGPAGEALFTFTGDTPGQPPTGASVDWQPFTGTPVPVTAGS